jgi:two-component sensor histidine kinase
MDVHMPGMDGFETASLLRKSSRTRALPVIFVTALVESAEFQEKGYGLGAIDVIFKPVQPSILRSKVAVFLSLHEQRRLLEESVREKELFLKEIHHRIKNNLAVISSIIALQADLVTDESAKTAFEQLRKRIESVALVHERLYRDKNLGRVDMRAYLAELLGLIVGTMKSPASSISARVEAGELRAAPDLAVPIGLLVTECATNSLKHAFPGGGAGTVFVELSLSEGRARLRIGDDGIGMPAQLHGGREGSLGMRLAAALAELLGGRLKRLELPGTVFEVAFAAAGRLDAGNDVP